MSGRVWTVAVGITKFYQCDYRHGRMEVCRGCIGFMGDYHSKVRATSTAEAMRAALLKFEESDLKTDGYEVVSLIVDPLAEALLPPPASSGRQRRPPAPRGSTASKPSGAHARDGRGRRKA